MLITNDGATILKQMEVIHPTAKMLVEISKAQDIEAGDGTTSVVVIAGALLQASLLLLEKGIHPSAISAGYQIALEKAIEVIAGNMINGTLLRLVRLARAARVLRTLRMIKASRSIQSLLMTGDCNGSWRRKRLKSGSLLLLGNLRLTDGFHQCSRVCARLTRGQRAALTSGASRTMRPSSCGRRCSR